MLALPLVSVGLPVFNCQKTIAEAVTSLVNQSFSDWELLIIDDGSTDRTAEVVRQFRDGRIRLFIPGSNLGLPTRLNECVALARGKLFARMDADDVAYPRRLASQVDFLDAHPDVDLVAGSVVVFKGNGIPLGVRRYPAQHEQLCRHAWSGIGMPHPTWMGRLEWFRRNPYRTDAHRMEDRELLFRTHTVSRFATLREVVLGYREDCLELDKMIFARKHTCKTMLRYAREHRDYVTAALAIGGELAKSALDAIAVGSGLDYKLLRHRARPISPAEKTEWECVWRETTAMALTYCMSDAAQPEAAVVAV